MKLTQTILTLTLATFTGALVMAQPPGGPHAPHDFTVLKTYLALTDAQVTSLQELNHSARVAGQAVQTDLRTKHQALNAAIRGGATDPTAVSALAQAVQAGEAKMLAIRQDYQTQAVGMLTADQKVKLAALSAAAALTPHIREAEMLNLITPPAGEGPGGGFRRGFGGPGGPAPAAQNQ